MEGAFVEEEKPGRVARDDHELYARIVTSYTCEELVRWGEHDRHAFALERRRELLKILANSKSTMSEKRRLGQALVIQQLEFHVGWESLMTFGADYQLSVEEPWYKPGDFAHTHAQFLDAAGDPKLLEQLGFRRILRQTYIDRTRRSIMELLMSRHDSLKQVSALIALYTAGRHERKRIAELSGQIWDELFALAKTQLEQHITPIPMQSLYGLAKEARNLSGFCDDLKLTLDATNPNIALSSLVPEARAMVREQNGQQRLLFLDEKLVNRRDDLLNQFIEVDIELDGDTHSVFDAIMKAMEKLPIDERLMEHLPRVTAAFFNAAQRDRNNQDIASSGTFWGTKSGRRLARMSGFDPDNYKHRAIIQDIRALLCEIILHREIMTTQRGAGRKRARWRGPLLEARRSELEFEAETPEGFTAHQTFQSWSIAAPLWAMVTPSEQGGTPSFMALDERAFYLDTRSSVPFNLYWVLVNRAYMQRLGKGGTLAVKISVLYEWAGLQGRFDRPVRLRAKLRDAFSDMVDHGLLEAWGCEELDEQSSSTFDEIMKATLEVTFSTSHLKSFAHLLPEADRPASQLPQR